MNELVERARDMVRSDMDARKIRFEAELPEPPLSVRLDRDRMTQVLLNLFLNAVQAMPDGGRLMVRARMEGTELALDVADTGAASPPTSGGYFQPVFHHQGQRHRGWGFPLCTRSWKRTTARSKSPARPARARCSSFVSRLWRRRGTGKREGNLPPGPPTLLSQNF